MTQSDDVKLAGEQEGKKLWVFWVFGLGFFAGFLVSLAVADKIKPKDEKAQSANVAQPSEPAPAEVASKESHEVATKSDEHSSHEPTSPDANHEEVQMTRAMRDRILTFDFLKVLQDAEIHRYRFEGETRGIILKKIRTGSIFAKVGLQDGDIIEQINGVAVADIDKRRAEMAQKLPGADTIDLRVRRGDKPHRIRIKITQPAIEP